MSSNNQLGSSDFVAEDDSEIITGQKPANQTDPTLQQNTPVRVEINSSDFVAEDDSAIETQAHNKEESKQQPVA